MRSRKDRNFGFRVQGIVRILTGADVREVAEALEILGLEVKEGLDVGKGDIGRDLKFLFDQLREGLQLQKDSSERLDLEIKFAIIAFDEHYSPHGAEAADKLRLKLKQGVALQDHFRGLGLAVRRFEETYKDEIFVL